MQADSKGRTEAIQIGFRPAIILVYANGAPAQLSLVPPKNKDYVGVPRL